MKLGPAKTTFFDIEVLKIGDFATVDISSLISVVTLWNKMLDRFKTTKSE